MSLVGGYCRVVSAFRGAFCCALPDIFRSFRTRPGVARMGRPARPRAVHGRAGHSLTVPHPWLGSQYCLRAAQAQSGRSKKLPAQRCSSAFNASSQLSRGSAGISVIRRVGTGAGAGRLGRDRGRGLSLRRVGMARAPVHRLWVLMAWRRTRAAPARAPTRGGVLPGRCRHVPVPGLAAAAGAVAATARGWRPTRRCAPNGVLQYDQQHERAVDRQGIERGERGPAHAPAGDGRASSRPSRLRQRTSVAPGALISHQARRRSGPGGRGAGR